MTEPVKPVFWYQGLFLQPQHFQQAERYQQSLHFPLTAYLQPFFWGTCGHTVDEGALREMVFNLSDGEFIFQDGAWVGIGHNGKIQPRSFKDAWTDMDRPFKVYIGIRRWDRGESNVTVTGGQGVSGLQRSRFVASEEPEEMKDLYHGNQISQVKLLEYAPRFFWEQETADAADYHLMPLSVLTFNGQDVVLSRDFVTPAVTMASSDVLTGAVKNIRELLLSRCRILEEYKNPRGFQKIDLQAAYLNFFLALRTLNRYIPLLQHLAETSTVHPWTAYGLLRQIAGELSSFTDRVDALGRLHNGNQLIPSYDHEDLGLCFRQVQTLIEEIMATMLIGMENIIHLTRDAHYFRASLSVELIDDLNLYYLIIKTSEKQEAVIDMVKHVVKAGSDEEVAVFITRALPGVHLEHRAEMPPGLPKRPGMLCFEIDRSSPHWHDVLTNRNITLYWPDAPEDTIVELAILKP